MADSIAKLAVVITGDASPLAAAMQKASAHVDSWSRGMATMAVQNDKWIAGLEKMRGAENPFASLKVGAAGAAGSMDRLHTASLKVSTVMSAMRGNLGAAFSVGGPAALGVAAMTVAVYKLASAGDALMEKLGADKLSTWTGQWARLNEQLGVMGSTFTTIAAEASGVLADALAGINAALFPDQAAFIKALEVRQAADKKAIEDKKEQEKENKKQLAINKKIAEEQQKARDAMLDMSNANRDRAEDIRQSVLTPLEKMKQSFVEIRALMSGGFMDDSTALRAGLAARKAFDEAMKKDKVKERENKGTAAADKFTMAGFSAVQGGLREIERLERVQKDQLKEEQNQTAVLKEVRDAIQGQTPVVLIAETP